MLLPGTCCYWKSNFGDVIPLLEKKFRVAVISYSGFDETQDSKFVSMIDETILIEDYIRKNYNGNIEAAYGCSLGGSFVLLLVQRKNIHINKAIIGSSDMDQATKFVAKLETEIVVPVLCKIAIDGELPEFMRKRLEKSDEKQKEYSQKLLNKLFSLSGGGMKFFNRESIYNQFYSDLVTKIENNIQVKNTEIIIFYAKKMGKKYLSRYKQHFADPIIYEDDLQHEELLCCYPQKWSKRIENICFNS